VVLREMTKKFFEQRLLRSCSSSLQQHCIDTKISNHISTVVENVSFTLRSLSVVIKTRSCWWPWTA
jgi:hypothetical protein